MNLSYVDVEELRSRHRAIAALPVESLDNDGVGEAIDYIRRDAVIEIVQTPYTVVTEAALAQQAQLPYRVTSVNLAADGASVLLNPCPDHPDFGSDGDYCGHASREVPVRHAQQAQPLTDEDASRIALAVFDADGPDSRAVVHDIVLRYEAHTRRRDRMAQQGQPRCAHTPTSSRICEMGTRCCNVRHVAAPQPEDYDDVVRSYSIPESVFTEPEDALAELDSIASEAVAAHAPNIANRIGLVLAALRAVSQPTREQIGHLIIGRVIRYPMPTVGDCWEIADAVLALYAKSEAKP